MYKICGFIAILFFCLEGTCQTDKIFPDSIAYWREGGLGGDIDLVYIDFKDYIITGDTIVNGINYKNLYLHRRAFKTDKGQGYTYKHFQIDDRYGLTNKLALIRRDSLKIFIRYLPKSENKYNMGFIDTLTAISNEYLLMDFALKKGDTIFSAGYTPGSAAYLVAKNHVNTIINGDTVKFLTFNGYNPAGISSSYKDSNIFVYGMGFNRSLFFGRGSFDTTSTVNFGHGGTRGVCNFCSDGKSVYRNGINGPALDCSNIDMKVSVGVKPIELQGLINIYPNPVKDILTVSGIVGPDFKIKITSALGQAYPINSTLNGADVLLDVSGLAPGLYFLTVETGGRVTVARFIKQ